MIGIGVRGYESKGVVGGYGTVAVETCLVAGGVVCC